MLKIQNIMICNSLLGIKIEKWRMKILANGLYFVRLEVEEYKEVKKLVLIRQALSTL